jgi:predicted metal-binding protein
MSHLSAEKLVKRAVETGVQEAKVIDVSTVVVSDWVPLKCQFGCGGYGQCLTCPPFSPTPRQTRAMLADYRRGVLLHNRGRRWAAIREAVAQLERDLFLKGYHKAFGMGSGPCHLCETCDVEARCRYPREARPAMEACSIDVFSTARANGFTIRTVRTRRQTPDFFGLVLVE